MRRLLAAVMVVLTIGMFSAGTATAAPVTLKYRDVAYIDMSGGERTQTRGSELGGALSGDWQWGVNGATGGAPVLTLTWMSEIDYGNGDALLLSGTGTINVNTLVFTGTETVVDGIGRYAGATGTLNVRGRYLFTSLRFTSSGDITIDDGTGP
ncbi:MAG: hypothetical protein WAS51_17470 [Ilumatobacteraceae bacterium]